MHSTAPSFWLSRFVEDIRVVAPILGRAPNVDRLPDGRTTLVFRVFDGGQRGDVTVLGPRTRALFKDATGVARALFVQFKPGWSAPLLGVATNELTNRFVKLEDIWGRSGTDLCLELLEARGLSDALNRISRAIALRSPERFESASAHLARRAVRLLEGE